MAQTHAGTINVVYLPAGLPAGKHDNALLLKERPMNNIQKVRRPRRFTDSELAKVGVEIIDPYTLWLMCTHCYQAWSPNIQRGGKLPRGYWKCPDCYRR